MIKKKLLYKIFKKNEAGKEYIIFQHSDKTWVLPNDSLETALEMYQPSTMRGKVLKSCVKLFHNTESILKKFGAKKERLCMKPEILLHLQELIGECDFFVAAYMGDTTTKQNNKVTLQVYNTQRVFCYAKVSEEPEVLENFSREIDSLKYLEEKGVTNIPKVLGDKEIQGLRIFVQSTDKPLKQQVRLEFGKNQIEFIENIVKKTKTDVKYETSQFYESIQYLKSVVAEFEKQEQTVIEAAIRQVETYAEEKGLEFAFSHGDYTPWNVYYVDGELFAFDFEYCYQTMPCHMDIFHYFTQFSIMGQHNDVEKTILLYQERKEMLKEYVENPDVVYVCYLLHIIAFYHNRTEEITEQVKQQMKIWIGLLEHFIFSDRLLEQ